MIEVDFLIKATFYDRYLSFFNILVNFLVTWYFSKISSSRADFFIFSHTHFYQSVTIFFFYFSEPFQISSAELSLSRFQPFFIKIATPLKNLKTLQTLPHSHLQILLKIKIAVTLQKLKYKDIFNHSHSHFNSLTPP